MNNIDIRENDIYDTNKLNNINENSLINTTINTIKNNNISSFEISTENVKNITLSNNYHEYKSFKFLGIKFYKLGNLYAFCFIKNKNYPLFCTEKHCYLHLIIYFIEFLIYIFCDHYLYKNMEAWRQVIFYILLFSFFFFYSFTVFINPGIVLENPKNNKFDSFCRKCNICYESKKITHCYECDICIENCDHHCGVLRKCIAKNNLITFWSMIISFILLYIFSLINMFIYLIYYYKKTKKT